MRSPVSRSERKPYYGNGGGSKWFKSRFNRNIRRNVDEELPDNKFYKKLNEVYCSPMEYKHGYWDVPRLRRK
jgi:hypothetical protein